MGLRNFLSKPASKLTVYLPDLMNAELIRSIMAHFDDGPYIPGLIADACSYFIDLQKEFGAKVELLLYEVYPTYSFYRFDDTIVAALYPTTAVRRDVPAFRVAAGSKFGEFIINDISELKKYSRTLSPKEFPKILTSIACFSSSTKFPANTKTNPSIARFSRVKSRK